MGGTAWVAVLSWLGEHSPPLVAGFFGGIIGAIVRDRIARRRHKEG